MTIIYVIQHGEKERLPGDPGLTDRGHRQAGQVADQLRDKGLSAVFASPALRARQTAAPLGEATGLAIDVDDRLRERVNWDGVQSFQDFLGDWSRATIDRDYRPRGGDSSRQAGERFREFVLTHQTGESAMAVAAHGGVTVDLLRTLRGDEALPAGLLTDGIAPGAITTLDGLAVVEIGAVSHLED